MIAYTCSVTSGRDVNILDRFQRYPCSLIGRLVRGFRAGSSVSVFHIGDNFTFWLCLLGCGRRAVMQLHFGCLYVGFGGGEKGDLLQHDPFTAYA